MSSFVVNSPLLNDAAWNSLDARNNWIALDSVASNAIEAAFSSGIATADIEDGGGISYTVNFCDSSMKTNGRRSRTIKLQRQSNNLGVPDIVWQWNDNGTWVEYGLDENDAMNVAKAGGMDLITLIVGSGSSMFTFKIDFINNRQISVGGRGNGFIRTIRSQATTTATTTSTASAAPAPLSVASALTPSTREMIIQSVLQNAKRGTAPEDEECVVCMEPFTPFNEGGKGSAKDCKASNPSLQLAECGPHYYHETCITCQLRLNGKCAVCGKHYVSIQGIQPKNGTMTHTIHPPGNITLEGIPPTIGTIVISYQFPSGVQGAEHPNPGKHYSGTHRTAFLPDNVAGRELLGMLQQAFNQRLVFTVGRSVTTGADNCVVWNGIHHKTNTFGGSSHFGWPDETYFERVKEELAAKGIRP